MVKWGVQLVASEPPRTPGCYKTRVVKFFFFLQGKAPKEIHAILTETLVFFLPGRAKDLSAPLCISLLTITLYFNVSPVSLLQKRHI